jgi:glutamate-5-semialdehyde dehydrogenase
MEISRGVSQVAALPDPIGEVTDMRTLENGLIVGRRRVPLGVIGMIYEARPNVTVDAAALCLKAASRYPQGRQRGHESNTALVAIMRDALDARRSAPGLRRFGYGHERASAEEMMRLTGYLDVLIPRGGAG